ncbi:alpha-amylase family glycosyl hydrolase [Halomonas sp. 1390]|uniref:alpha-amylase family glycosyl hydrolase n=1 Tax=Halomonas sp. B23F22_3 TaxID=3459516 RepID=UPI00373FB922
MIDRLDYIASLNVDAIWLSPFFTSPMKDFGFDVSDYRGVDPMFGTLEDFDRLVEAAHARGLRVAIDQVLSHSSDQHAWLQESRQSHDTPRPT